MSEPGKPAALFVHMSHKHAATVDTTPRPTQQRSVCEKKQCKERDTRRRVAPLPPPPPASRSIERAICRVAGSPNSPRQLVYDPARACPRPQQQKQVFINLIMFPPLPTGAVCGRLPPPRPASIGARERNVRKPIKGSEIGQNRLPLC